MLLANFPLSLMFVIGSLGHPLIGGVYALALIAALSTSLAGVASPSWGGWRMIASGVPGFALGAPFIILTAGLLCGGVLLLFHDISTARSDSDPGEQ